jgi:AraC-like DNA-binding protein
MVAYIRKMEEHLDCIHTVKVYIREHINEPLHREVLAEIAGFSIPHFHRIFTAQTGESAASYIRRLRLYYRSCSYRRI